MSIPGESSEIRLGHPRLLGRTGAGIVIAVVDSGVHAAHPHVEGVTTGVAVGRDGATDEDWVDRLGHGTAVTAAIKEKAPAAEVLAVKVFDKKLSTSARALVHAIDWASANGARLVNLSLGTANDAHEGIFASAVARAVDRGALVVAAMESEGVRWLPGSLEGAVGVRLDWDCPRDAVRMTVGPDGRPAFRASGYPRPIPGVPPARNLQGISFAVANVTGVLARVLEGQPGPTTAQGVAALADLFTD